MNEKRDPFLEAVFAALGGRLSPEELGERTEAEIERLYPDWERIAREAGERGRPAEPKAPEPVAPPPNDPPPADPADSPAADPRHERRAARRDLNRLKKLDPEERIEAIRNALSAYRGRELVDLLLAEATAALRKKPKEAPGWIDCALEVAKAVPFPRPDDLPRLRVRLLAHRANALRVLGDLQAADELWEEIRVERKKFPPASLREQAELWSLEASLRRDQRRFTTAATLLEAASRTYQRSGDQALLARTLCKRGTVADYAGDSRSALALQEAAAALVSLELDARLHWTIQHNRADTLVQLGRTREAAQILEAARPWFEQHGDDGMQVRSNWLEGKIAWSEGRLDEAQNLLRTVARDCAAQGLAYDAALATLDRAGLALQQGKLPQVKRLAAALEPVFRFQKVHREAEAALRLFQEAAKAETVTLAFLAALRRYLELARHDPAFVFTPPALLPPR